MGTERRARLPRRPLGRAAPLVPVALVALVAVSGCGSGGVSLDPQAQAGQRVAEQNGCTSCHSSDGSRKVGPTWKGIWGRPQPLEGGGTAIVDRDYIARSIGDPQAQVVAGFSPIMPRFSLSDQDIDAVAAYIRALGGRKGSA